MQRRIAAAVVAALGLVMSLLISAPFASGLPFKPAQADGFRIENGRLVEANGNEFIIRGVSHAHAWYTDELDSLKHIKAKGANTVRVVLSSGDHAEQWGKTSEKQVSDIISRCKANKLICMLEVHDTTGYGEDQNAAPLSKAVDYWISIKNAVIGHEKNVLVNIGNEPYGNTGYEQWTQGTTNAIKRLRAAGFNHTLVADGPNWGQDHTFTMRDNAAKVFAADPAKNTLFSVHMYGVYETPKTIQSYLNSFVDKGLPIMVGEFGHNHSDGNPDENAVMATTQNLGLGYIGWSWSGNGSDVAYLDMVQNFNPNSMTEWGKRIFNGPNGIKETAKEATVYQ